MSIPFQIPAEYLPKVAAGEIVRYGGILKHASNGQIIGHLKEVGKVSNLIDTLPTLSGGPFSTVVSIASAVEQHHQLKHMQQTLNSLNLISSVGATASVASLGISAVGFGLVLKRLKSLEQNLDGRMTELSEKLDTIQSDNESYRRSELYAALEQLAGADETEQEDRRIDLLSQSDATLQKHRHFYAEVIERIQPFTDVETPIPVCCELLGRYFATCLAELHANFMLNDFKQWRFRHHNIREQCHQLISFDAGKIARQRASAIPAFTESDLQQLGAELQTLIQFSEETIARIETAECEVNFLSATGINPAEYLHSVRQIDGEQGVILIPSA